MLINENLGRSTTVNQESYVKSVSYHSVKNKYISCIEN